MTEKAMSAADKDRNNDVLWAKIIEFVESLRKDGVQTRSTSRSQAYYSVGGKHCMATFDRQLLDGSSELYVIESYIDREGKCEIETTKAFHNSDPFWIERLATLDKPFVAIIDDTYYCIEKEPPLDKDGNLIGDGWSLGFGGGKHTIEFTSGPNAGQKIVTHNLWYGGVIPPIFRDRFKPNAKFISDKEQVCQTTN